MWACESGCDRSSSEINGSPSSSFAFPLRRNRSTPFDHALVFPSSDSFDRDREGTGAARTGDEVVGR
jgi:hypothetical protein